MRGWVTFVILLVGVAILGHSTQAQSPILGPTAGAPAQERLVVFEGFMNPG